jgi:hypothetical protein
VLIFGNEESLVMKLDEGAVPRIAGALANIPSRPSDDPPVIRALGPGEPLRGWSPPP